MNNNAYLIHVINSTVLEYFKKLNIKYVYKKYLKMTEI